jgi:hypothetical protein
MKTMELNFKMVLLFGTFIVLSGLIVSGLIFEKEPSTSSSGSSYPNMASGSGLNTPAAKPDPAVVSEEEPKETKSLPVVTLPVVTSQVKEFVPEFDDEWCKSKYPEYNGEKISLASHEFIVKDQKGSKITDYDELSLKLAPTSNNSSQLEKDFKFKDGYVDVKGIGPMKIKSVKFTFAEPEPSKGK